MKRAMAVTGVGLAIAFGGAAPALAATPSATTGVHDIARHLLPTLAEQDQCAPGTGDLDTATPATPATPATDTGTGTGTGEEAGEPTGSEEGSQEGSQEGVGVGAEDEDTNPLPGEPAEVPGGEAIPLDPELPGAADTGIDGGGAGGGASGFAAPRVLAADVDCTATGVSDEDGDGTAEPVDGLDDDGDGQVDEVEQVSVVPAGGAPTGDGSTEGPPAWTVGGGVLALLAAAGLGGRRLLRTTRGR